MAILDNPFIQEDSKIPKYQQVINLIKSDIEKGIFTKGSRIPSINETSEDFYLSRDTVEKAYNKLREQGIIVSVPGKGYYVSCDHPHNKIRVLLVINKISAHKKLIVHAFIETLGEQAMVETFVHHYSAEKLARILEEHLGNYHYYAIIPCFKDHSERIREVMAQIPSDKLLLIDKDVEGLKGNYRVVCEDFENDTYQVLSSILKDIRKYQRIHFIFPGGSHYQPAILASFRRFCEDHHFEYDISHAFHGEPVRPGSLYLVIEENDLVEILKYCKNRGLSIGKEVGIISYNDTPVKEVLHDGITVISTDFKKMGESAARLLLEKRVEKIKNPFYLIHRSSL